MPDQWIIPRRIQLEVVFGCNASCVMCPIDMPTPRKKGTMPFDMFKYIVDEMVPYRQSLEKFDFWGLGEPCLDPCLVQRVEYARKKGFNGLAIATNAQLLTGELAEDLFLAGLNTIIFSIDGTDKQTHENIRRNTDYDQVMENARQAISIRDEKGYDTRFVFRFVRQSCNASQWQTYQNYWQQLISREKNDLILGYDMHTWGGQVHGQEKMVTECVPDSVPCHHAFDRLIVLSDGTVPLCCADLHKADYAFGNVRDSSPIEVFNSPRAREIREMHTAGQRKNMKICSECTILESEKLQMIQ